MIGSSALKDSDIAFLIRTLMPECGDPRRMIKTIREDEEILEGMLLDDRLLHVLIRDPDALIAISPRLYFSVLVNRVRRDLSSRSYTVEQRHRHSIPVFDGEELESFLAQVEIRAYLVDMLSSFVRINAYSFAVRLRKGIWRRMRVGDFDLDSLITYSQTLEESRRFHVYKRIADLCLLLSGVYYECCRKRSDGPARPGASFPPEREKYEEDGRRFYQAAADNWMARFQDMDRVLRDFSRCFPLASKALTFLSDNYLANRRDRLYLH